MSLISVIIPTHNYGHLITETINCLFDQTFKDWEAIIVDDGSTDGTKDIVEKLISLDSRLSYIEQPNRGVSSARNLGLKNAKGKYIQFLDADDLISPNKIEAQLALMESNPEIDICLVNAKYFESENKEQYYSTIDKKQQHAPEKISGLGFPIIHAYLQNNKSVIQSPIFKKAIIESVGAFKETMPYLEDWDLWFRIAIYNYRFGFLDDESALALVRIHPLSASQKDNSLLEAEAELRALIKGYVINSTLPAPQKAELLALNKKLLINTFKYLMAKTHISDLSKFVKYYQLLAGSNVFSKAFLKSLNIRRKNI
ncbi:glycosyltransferase family 2 protein [Pedobacter xixiisoli]|uniref:Glycosyltransferase involved in cell wall bisynthesis n=1 Tax=Pedobacter xixiisoli TaxID=1476464 RepID=A0A286AD82_9SPHI|nr:glycosyltransferase [Pedobacter xixiisoli]SOD19853.1 Glycosyltransferase involved in cell wall bisynthesis [Pedobacter xixiisoli]